ncbi:MAG: hypothetical protein ACO2PN_10865 [Pyrobaculum sp.]|jgi:hypothetical protein
MKFFPLLYGLFVLAMALALVVSSKPGAVGPQTLTVDRLNLSLAPGDRHVLVFKSEVPVDVAVFRQRDFERGRPPVIALPRVLDAWLAMPTDVQVSYVVVASRPVSVEVRPGRVEETTQKIRRGEDVERAYVKFVGDRGTYQLIPRVAPGVVLKGRAEGRICLMTEAEFKRWRESGAVVGECFAGEFQKKFEDFADVYLVAVEPGVVEYAVYATLEMLLALGTCG